MKNTKEIKKMTRSQAGKLGAIALNKDSLAKSEAARKAAATRIAKNPNVFAEMGLARFKNKKKDGKDEQTK